MGIRIAIVDDKIINRRTVRSKLAGYKEIQIDFEAENGLELLKLLEDSSSLPDLVLIDLEMPEMDGIEAIARASIKWPEMKFIVLTVFEDSNRIFEAIKAGASGYLLKDDSALDIVDAITNVQAHNGIPMSPSIARKAMDLLRKLPSLPEESVTADPEEPGKIATKGLSNREMEILKHLAAGKNYKSIGETLFISPLTVRKHVVNIYEKLHVNSRAEIIHIAHMKRWI